MAWRRVDLHIHTPASTDYKQTNVSPLDILRQAEERGLDIIAISDHNSVRGYADMWREIEDLEMLEYLGRLNDDERRRLDEYRRLLARILVLPGFEFTATFGFHILAVFPEGTTVRMMEHLLLTLGVEEAKFGSGEVGATTDVLRAYKVLHDHGALVIGAHANSTHGIAMQGFAFGGQTKIAYTQDPHLHALEVTDLHVTGNRRSTARFFNGSKPEYPRRMHCIQGSDAHRLERDPDRDAILGVGDRATEMLLPSVSFHAIQELLSGQDFSRTRRYVPVVSPADALKASRDVGHSSTVAFHERSATKRDGQTPVLRDVVAMANSEGGVVYVGASANTRRQIAGIPNAAEVSAQLSEALSREVSPVIVAEVEQIEVDGRTVIVARVPVGTQQPYALSSGMIYVREGGETRHATRDEIVRMVQSAGPTAPDRTASGPAPQPPEASQQRQGRRRRRGGQAAQASPSPNGRAT
ncbi:MAG: RNA-binding domain-containing protein, partial [Thermomicrobiales bacterium]